MINQCDRGISDSSMGRLRLASFREELTHSLAADITQNAFNNFEPMIDRVIIYLGMAEQCPCLGLSSTEDDSRYSGMHHGANAHQTRFDGDVENRSGQPVVRLRLRGLAQGHNFSMSGWITARDGLIKPLADNFSIEHHKGSDRDLPYRTRRIGQGQGFRHPCLVVTDRVVQT